LRAERCNQGQGFLFSGPVNAVEMADLLEIAEAGKPITAVDPAPSHGGNGRPARPTRQRATSGGVPRAGRR
jgi:hypothetical protein